MLSHKPPLELTTGNHTLFFQSLIFCVMHIRIDSETAIPTNYDVV